MGTHTCGGYPGTEGHEDIDAKTFAEWGVGASRSPASHGLIAAVPTLIRKYTFSAK
jgi:hypothetical protein